MNYIDTDHKEQYYNLIVRMGAESDRERQALAYLITADTECRQHIERIYDFIDGCIIPECLSESWQTGTSVKTCRLAFNLFNGGLAWSAEEDRDLVTPAELFACELAPYYWQAIRIRYPEYTDE